MIISLFFLRALFDYLNIFFLLTFTLFVYNKLFLSNAVIISIQKHLDPCKATKTNIMIKRLEVYKTNNP